MTAPVPDHAMVNSKILQRKLRADELDRRFPEEKMMRVFCAAMEAAQDAAREVLEAATLSLTDEIVMHEDAWKYWESTCGAYNTTVPTGIRVGKRWCRTNGIKPTRMIGEYTEDSIIWRIVRLTKEL